MRLLLVEDDTMIGEAVQELLRAEHHAVDWARSGTEADAALAAQRYDLVLLDLGLPGRDGLDVLRALRARRDRTPVLITTARDAVAQRVQGLDAGADDYLLKPFAFAELVARLRALTRRATGPRWTPPGDDPLTLDDDLGVRFADRRVQLSPREHTLLAYLVRRRDEVVARGDILRDVFGYVGDPGTNTTDVHLAHLRRKLADAPLVIETIRGVGFRVRVGRT